MALQAIHWCDGAKTIIHIADSPAHGAAFSGAFGHEEEAAKLPPLIYKVASRRIVVSAMNIAGATPGFAACKKIYDEAGGCDFKIENLELPSGHGESTVWSTRSHVRGHGAKDTARFDSSTRTPRECLGVKRARFLRTSSQDSSMEHSSRLRERIADATV
jgi:hypothetical protein